MGAFNWLNNVSLKYKFAALLLFFGVVPALGMYGLFQALTPDFKLANQRQVRDISVEIMDKIDRNLFERYGDVQAFGLNATAHNPANWRNQSPENPLIVAMNNYAKTYGIYSLMILVGNDGKVLAVNTKNPQGNDIDTRAVYNLDFSGVSWFKKAVAGDFTKSQALSGTVVEQPTVSNLVAQIYGNDGFVITFAAPVSNNAGEKIGVWVNFADFAFVEEIVASSYRQLKSNGYNSSDVMLQGADGTLLVDYDTAKLAGKPYVRDVKALSATNLLKDGDRGPAMVQKGESGYLEEYLDGAEEIMVVGYAPSKESLGMPNLGWGMIVGVPQSEAYATVNALALQMLIGVGVAAAILCIIGYIVGAWTASPIKFVADTMKQIAKGETKMTLTPRGTDEIGQMTSALITLKDTVGDAYRLKSMVDDMPNGVFTANANDGFKINYLNASAKQLIAGATGASSTSNGVPIDAILPDGAKYRQIVSDHTRLPYFDKIKFGSETVELKIFAIKDISGAYVGPSINMQNVTKQLKIADDFEASVKGVVDAVASAATELQASSQSMTATAEETSRQSTTVAAASEEATANVQTVASAAEELSASVQEISRQVSKSVQIAGAAVTEAKKTDTTVQGLATAAQKIGDVVKLISDIAGQTNLLALNATIEAARAGEAGKGFAVVASEVKNLANQTARATDEITAQIGAIQTATNDAVEAIRHIAETISEMNQISTAISAAVEEQGATTKEIARNVAQAAEGSANVAETISGVSRAASETGSSAGQVLNAAGELSVQAERLRREVDNFLGSVRSAA
jgi:methyl-accepting chemotaxis protein